jgi:hypothetical protein
MPRIFYDDDDQEFCWENFFRTELLKSLGKRIQYFF